VAVLKDTNDWRPERAYRSLDQTVVGYREAHGDARRLFEAGQDNRWRFLEFGQVRQRSPSREPLLRAASTVPAPRSRCIASHNRAPCAPPRSAPRSGGGSHGDRAFSQRYRRDTLVDAVDDKPGDAVTDNLRNEPSPKGDHRCCIGHRFDQHKAERFGSRAPLRRQGKPPCRCRRSHQGTRSSDL
jgi:hypothetical protein